MVSLVVLGIFGQRVSAQGSSENRDSLAKNHVDLPDRVSVEAPGKEIPSEFAGFSGAWSGDGWNGIVPTALVVEKIDQDGSAGAIFAWGDIARTRLPRGWLRVTASIKQGMLSFSIPDHGTAEYTISPDGRLFARYKYVEGTLDHAILSRIPGADRQSIILASQGMLSGEDVTLPLLSGSNASQNVQLRGILYRSAMAGPRPLVIFSGDTVAAEDARGQPNRAPFRSRQMLGLGYSMLVLQRKGMGGSGGKFMEPRDESISQQAQLQSALDDLDAAVTFMKQQQYVDPSRIVVMGINRGGLLSVAYAGSHDGAVAGVVNLFGNWRVRRSWWQEHLPWEDFTATQVADAGKKTKVPMLWIYGGANPAAVQYARENFRAFTYHGGRGTFVEASVDSKPNASNWVMIEKQEKAIVDYIQSRR